jgi:hypothetical protein
MIVRLFKDWAFWLLFFPSVALWLMTIAVFASNGPIHFSSRKDDVITEEANPTTCWSLKFSLLLITLAFSVAVLLRYRTFRRGNI